MEQMIPVTIDGVQVEVPAGSTVLEAAHKANVKIPTLCFLKDINETANCRICVVDCGGRTLQAACVLPVTPGMVVKTNTPAVREARRMNLELILSNHDKKCLTCVRSENCELQTLCKELGVENSERFAGARNEYKVDSTSDSIVRNNNKCILCRRCVAACQQQFVSVIGANDRGIDTHIACAFEKPLGDVPCVSCGQCINVCPTGALREKDNTAEVFEALSDPDKVVLVQTAPAVRAAIGEEFGLPIGTPCEGKMVAALRRLGFDKVFDTDFAADMTIVEEATELVDRVKNGGVLPMITSCSPGWVKFAELYYPEQLANLSTCKSPQQMFGAILKTYYAEKNGIDPRNIVSVSVMPCTAKKFEITREDEDAAGVPDVDISITTRELARMIRRAGLNFTALPDEEFDMPLGADTGAAVIFGATGGVMEAALRTANDVLTGKDNGSVDFTEVRGMEGLKEATYNIAGLEVKVAVASGLTAANHVMSKIKDGTAPWTFVEIMCCPGGCINGGGQPIVPAVVRNFEDYRAKRAKVLYDMDRNMPLRKSHQNPMVVEIYKDYFESFGSHKAHEVLHTHYTARKKFH